jgi:ABC-2 type transport system permease protein
VRVSRGPLRPLLALIRKELVQAFRNRPMLFMISVAPLVQIVLFGYAAQLEFRRADTVVVDQDRSPESRALIDGLGAEGTFRIRDVADVAAATVAIRDGRAAVAVVVPRGFGRDRAAGRPVAVQVLADGSDPTRGIAASAAIEGYTATQLRGPPGAPTFGRISLEPRLLYNPGLESQRFFVPGTAASLLVIVTMLVTAMGLARERELGTLEQLLVTPIGPFTLMVGKMVPYALFGLLDVTLILLIGSLLFGVPLHGDLAVLGIASVGYLMCTLSLGLLIAASAKTQQRAFMAGFFVMLPAMLLSGFMTPIEAMPRWIRPLTLINPMRHFVEVLRSILLRGAGWSDVQRPIAWLFGLGTCLLVGAALRFRRKLA